MHLVVIMDSPEMVLVEADTSFALMLEAQRRGHRVDHCLISDVSLEGGRVHAWVHRVTLQEVAASPMVLSERQYVPLDNVDIVLVRKDPPFDPPYLWLTLLLEHLRGKSLVVNDPRGLREANEKLFACYFPNLMPETLVTSNASDIRKFVNDVGGHAVIKPIDGAAGSGVLALGLGDPNFNAIVETATRHGCRVAMVQRYLEAVREGDKRILLLEGEPLGALLRVPQGGDLRSNLHVGGLAAPAELDKHDLEIIEKIGPSLVERGLHFVGIDVIGGKLTEVNVTSPTGIQQMSRLGGINLSAKVVDWLERAA
ncbi:MAG: glutathione synthase [Myxococcales bacterium]|nr:glutathione synthase [Myxococcales bacterium]MCB9707435.1 glutathione synthase [Myxococcales bacterium]